MLDTPHKHRIQLHSVKDLDHNYKYIEHYLDRLKDLVEDIVAPVNVHAVSRRLKDRVDILEKVRRKECKTLDDMTDICGIRIITSFADEVERVGAIIEAEFDVDARNSEDKRNLLAPDQFGYLSRHYIVRLSKQRRGQTEFKPFKAIPVEIQIRSLLQHTWAEIGHKLLYKKPYLSPSNVQRRFYRLAGLLELADAELLDIRDQVHTCNANRVARNTLPINRNTLAAYVQSSRRVAKLDTAFKNATHFPIVPSPAFIDVFVPRLLSVQYASIGDIDKSLKIREGCVLQFGTHWYSDPWPHVPLIPQGICLSFLCLLSFLEADNTTGLFQFLSKHRYLRGQDPTDLGNRMVHVYQRYMKSQFTK